ncbi:MAG TPA: type II secretion system protein, partial [Phycisphaerae bacterium]|nr:type II secretion system protein [Phycisphaerae bacterium]
MLPRVRTSGVSRFGRRNRRGRTPTAAGFTLLELLTVSAILVVLVGIMAAAVGKVRGTSRAFVCKNNLKTVAFEFFQFADDYAHPYRGDSDDGRPGFRIDDFQERLYRIAEFWDRGSA